MSCKNWFVSVLALMALLLSACQPVMPTASTARPHTPRQDAPPYGVRGPYAVGVRNFVIEPENENQRQLNVTVWYPTLNPEAADESVTYEMGFAPGEMPNFTVAGRAIPDAPPASADGAFPLVVQTHAHWTFRQEMPYLSEHLASHGLVVISADHEDNWGTAFGAKAWQSEFRRPDEVRRELDFAATLTAPDGTLAGIVDMAHAGVFGWSYGGETALVTAGARLDTIGFRAFCEENKVGDEWPDTDCVDILDHEAELAALAGLDAVPEDLWPDWSDARIDAAVALAPWVGMIGATGLQSVDVPTLLIIGSGDTGVGFAYRLLQPYARIGTDRKSEVTLAYADHNIYISDCNAAPGLVEMGFQSICADPVWDMTRAHDLINHFATAFLLAELKGDTDAAAALAPENVAFSGIQYETTAFDAQ